MFRILTFQRIAKKNNKDLRQQYHMLSVHRCQPQKLRSRQVLGEMATKPTKEQGHGQDWFSISMVTTYILCYGTTLPPHWSYKKSKG